MTNILTVTRRIQFAAFAAIIAVMTLWSFSCKKSTGSANAKFLGTYHGTNCKDSVLPDLVITSGANGSLISVAFVVDTAGCTSNIGVIGVVSGNDVTFSTQSFNDLCGNVLVVSGSGSINGNTVTINLSGLTSLSGSAVSGTKAYCFTGNK